MRNPSLDYSVRYDGLESSNQYANPDPDMKQTAQEDRQTLDIMSIRTRSAVRRALCNIPDLKKKTHQGPRTPCFCFSEMWS